MYNRFKRLLELKGVTPYRVGKETGIGTATLTEWKKGDYTPKRDKLVKIAEYFDVPVTYFYEEDEEENTKDLIEAATKYLAQNLRDDQKQIIQTAASLSPEEVKAVDLFIKTLKGKGIN